ncbi:MAG: GNAT family N-acetyltransferase, partial [Turicibacter sp.]|nr:GNAT family N-acetyltransferase [Turicibacter sp.]
MLTHKGTQRIETERLILRPFKLSDANDMFKNWASDDEVTKYLTWPTHSS